MKKIAILSIVLIISISVLTGCKSEAKKLPEGASVDEIKTHLIEGNQVYQNSIINNGDVSKTTRDDIYQNGQKPYAVIITCSDSRVPPEHVFNAGLGELFVIRTAGNVVGNFEIGSVEYAVEHLGSKLVIVMGHTKCGAVEAALGADSHGYISTIVNEVRTGIGETTNTSEAEILNAKSSMKKINNSDILKGDKATIVSGIYDISNGKFSFLE